MTTTEPTPEAVEARALADAVLAEPPMSDDGTGHIADCGYDEDGNPPCGCMTLPERIVAAVLAAGYVKPEWKPGRWYRAVAPDGSLWLETSNPHEAVDRARSCDRLQRLWVTVIADEWRDYEPESGS